MRLFPSQASELLVILTWLHHVKGQPQDVLYGELYNTYKNGALPYDISSALKRTQLTTMRPHHSVEQLLEQFSSYHYEASKHEGDIVDFIIKQLNLPFPQNVLSKDLLKILSKALIDPSEMGPLQAKLEQQEMHCFGCGRLLKAYEAVTTAVSDKRVVLYCGLCFTPKATRCINCGEPVPFELRYGAKPVNLENCDWHQTPKKKKVDKEGKDALLG